MLASLTLPKCAKRGTPEEYNSNVGQRHNAFGDVDGSNLQTLGADLDTNHEAVNPSRSWFEDSMCLGVLLVPKTIRSTSL